MTSDFVRFWELLNKTTEVQIKCNDNPRNRIATLLRKVNKGVFDYRRVFTLTKVKCGWHGTDGINVPL